MFQKGQTIYDRILREYVTVEEVQCIASDRKNCLYRLRSASGFLYSRRGEFLSLTKDGAVGGNSVVVQAAKPAFTVRVKPAVDPIHVLYHKGPLGLKPGKRPVPPLRGGTGKVK